MTFTTRRNLAYKKVYVRISIFLSGLIILLLYQILTRRDSPSSLVQIINYRNIAQDYDSDDEITTPDYRTEVRKRTKNVIDVNNNYTILLWVAENCTVCSPFDTFGHGNFAVKHERCTYQNCYVTSNKSQVNHEDFDVILFSGRYMYQNVYDVPKTRRQDQIFAFVQIESAARFPVCNRLYDNFFNLTITHRLDSDIPWPYVLVKDANGTIVAPNRKPKWKTKYREISDEIKKKIDSKDKLAVWFVSNCVSVKNTRELYIKTLDKELAKISNFSIDIYGKCGKLQCLRTEQDKCDKLMEDHYLFFMAFENTSEEDYVTEKVYRAMHNNLIPVVYGGANYKRFLPRGSYINAGYLEPAKLAKKLIDIYYNRKEYYEYFRWKEFYNITINARGFFCRLCEMLNTEQNYKRYKSFRSWWNKKNKCY